MKDGDQSNRGPTPKRRVAAIRSANRPQPGERAEAAQTGGADGRSGYGSESVRPFLRAQLRQKELMAGPQLGWESTRKRIKL